MVKVITNSQGKVYTASGKALISVGGGDFQLTRISDDNGNEIGTHFMDFTDGNGQEYKVVLLDAQYRQANTKFMSSRTTVTNLPQYGYLYTSNIWESRETATFNTQKILDFCSANNYTSDYCTHCRSKSFVINGTTYYGQAPNEIEIANIVKNYHELGNLDITSEEYSTTNFSANRNFCSSNQHNYEYMWGCTSVGAMGVSYKLSAYLVCPVIEIPNN